MTTSPAFIAQFPHFPFRTAEKRIQHKRFRCRPTPHAAAAAAAPKQAQTFNWKDQWYPVALTTDLNPVKPNPITLQSTPLVAFRSNENWTVLHDRCPHRHASLSHGRITEDRIECLYHGWQFDHSGMLRHIPQSHSACPTMSAKSVRSVVLHGILFCSLGNPETTPAVVNWGSNRFVVSSFTRVLPLCFTTVIQNLLDPAHIHFAHHGMIGRREAAEPIPIRILSPVSSEGFTADYYSGTVRLRFRPPCLVEIVTSRGYSFAYYTTPLSKGVSKAFAIRAKAQPQLFVPPRWMDHLRRHTLLEGDLELMRSQQGYMERHGGYHESWKDFCMPTSADRLIVEMLKWMDKFAPDEDWYGCQDSTDSGRWAHTRECRSCWGMWVGLGVARRFAKVVGLICLLGAAACGSVIMALVAGSLTGIARSLQWTQHQFE